MVNKTDMNNLTTICTAENVDNYSSQKEIQLSNFPQGVFSNAFYYGRYYQNEELKIPSIITSEKKCIYNLAEARLPNGKLKSIGKNGFEKIGFHIKYPYLLKNRSWSINGIKDYLKGKEVDSKDLFNKIKNSFEKYIDFFNPLTPYVLSAYILNTYCFTLFNTVGYIFLNSNKESGKTKTMNLIELMCFNPVNATNPSESGLFRMCEYFQPTLLIDDYENIEKNKFMALNQILKVGYKRQGTIIRSEKINDSFEPREFSIFGPKVISNTKGLDPITQTRCILVPLIKTKTDKGRLEPDAASPEWQEIVDDCHNFVMNNWREIKDNYKNFQTTEFNNRDLELIRGLLAITNTIDPEITKNLVTFLKESFQERNLQDAVNDWEYTLFNSILDNMQESRFYRISEISNWCYGKIGEDQRKTSLWIGRTLSRVPIIKKRRMREGIEYYLDKKKVIDWMERSGLLVENADSITTTRTTLQHKDDKVTLLPVEIYDICTDCQENKLVQYTSLNKVGRNYCKECIEKETKKLYNYI